MSIIDFCHLNPPIFQGKTDLLMAEGWLRQIAKTLDAMGVVNDATRIFFGDVSVERFNGVMADERKKHSGCARDGMEHFWQFIS